MLPGGGMLIPIEDIFDEESVMPVAALVTDKFYSIHNYLGILSFKPYKIDFYATCTIFLSRKVVWLDDEQKLVESATYNDKVEI